MIVWIEIYLREKEENVSGDAVYMIVWIEILHLFLFFDSKEDAVYMIIFNLDKNCRLVYQTRAAIYNYPYRICTQY